MKRLISIFLISTLALTLLCGCEGDNNVSSDVSKIDAVVNMSSEETPSETENVSSIESVVSSKSETSSQTTVISSEVSVSSEVSTPTQIIEGTPINFEVGYSKHNCYLIWEDFYKNIIDSVEELEEFEKTAEISELYSVLKAKYDEEFFDKKSIVFVVVTGANSSFTRCECNNVTRKDSKLLIYASEYINRTPGLCFLDALVPHIMILEVEKSDISGVEEVVINTQKVEYTE